MFAHHSLALAYEPPARVLTTRSSTQLPKQEQNKNQQHTAKANTSSNDYRPEGSAVRESCRAPDRLSSRTLSVGTRHGYALEEPFSCVSIAALSPAHRPRHRARSTHTQDNISCLLATSRARSRSLDRALRNAAAACCKLDHDPRQGRDDPSSAAARATARARHQAREA